MKIGVSTSVFLDSDKNLSEALEILEKKVKYVELGCDGNMNV
ncbi:MAG: sugar phosphate isomerase/epimerase, partial [Methanocaldococcus sp.]